jgi:hypothetical protein
MYCTWESIDTDDGPQTTTHFKSLLLPDMVWGNKLYHKAYLPSTDTLARRTRYGQQFVSKLIAYGHSNF